MKKESGSSLLMTLCVIAALSVCLGVALSFTSSVSRHVHRSNHFRQAIEIGDGVMEYAFAHWREKSRPTPNIHLSTDELADLPLPTAALFPDVVNFSSGRAPNSSFTVSNYKVQAVNPEWKSLASVSQAPPPAYGMSLGTASYYYLASADITLPTIAKPPITVKMRRIFEKECVSPWNYAIFYTDPLEIHPGPQFDITGWVHTNSKLYTGHSSLRFLSKVTYGIDWVIGFRPGDSTHPGTPEPPSHIDNLPPALEQAHQPFGLDSSRIFSTEDSDPDNDSYREIVEPPAASTADPLGDARYYAQADVKLIVTDDAHGKPQLTILNKAGVACTAASSGKDRRLYETFAAAVGLNEKIQDNREGKALRIATLDMSEVNRALRPGGDLKNDHFNGVIYMSDVTASSTQARGIRLKNGGVMPAGGITIATDNPCYIQGDYNTGSTSTIQPLSNVAGGDPMSNVVAGYTKQPCAVVADAVMILSNSWNDALSDRDLSKRIAKPTTVNTAIVSGIVPSGGGKYSGGAENFVRFLEKWGSNTTFTYHGSMVQLFASEQSVGVWGKSNVYDPPKRKWFFETLFYTNPPPGSLTLIKYKKSRWYLE